MVTSLSLAIVAVVVGDNVFGACGVVPTHKHAFCAILANESCSQIADVLIKTSGSAGNLVLYTLGQPLHHRMFALSDHWIWLCFDIT